MSAFTLKSNSEGEYVHQGADHEKLSEFRINSQKEGFGFIAHILHY